MAQYSSANIGFVLVDGYNVMGTVTTLTDSVETTIQESSVFGDEWAKFVNVNYRKGALAQGGFFDDAVGSIHDALNGTDLSSLGDSRVFMYGLEGNVAGAHFVGYGGVIETKYERTMALEKLHMANAMYSPSGPIEVGQVLKPYAAISANGDTKATSVDQAADTRVTRAKLVSNSIANPTVVTTEEAHQFIDNDVILIAGVITSDPTINGERVATVTGAGGATKFKVPVNVTTGGTDGTAVRAWTKNGGAGFISCSALSLGGWTNLTAKVAHSADNGVWVDLMTFTAITTAPIAERKTVAAGTTVNRYLAASWAFTGAGAAHTATFVVGFVRA